MIAAVESLEQPIPDNCNRTDHIRKRLISEGLKKAACEVCKRKSWMGKPMPLQLDHINGQRSDNRLKNLRVLCPNCHAQTDTYCGKNKGSYRRRNNSSRILKEVA
ncbi:MAG: HNH endonuclease [Pyrinomonadaceae bacterium]